MRRGLTLLELLLAMTLLTGIAAAILPLTRSVIGGMQQIDQKLLWQRSAEMTLGEIDRLLLRRQRRDSGAPPVRIESGRLIIHFTGGRVASFGLDGGDMLLTADKKPDRLLIGNVAEASYAIDEERQVLVVRLSALDGEIAERTWELAR